MLLGLVRRASYGETTWEGGDTPAKALQNHRQMPAGRSEKIKAPYTRRMGSRSVRTSIEVEAANRAGARALLIREGYRVHRPEADCYGENLYGGLGGTDAERRAATPPAPVPTARALDEALRGAPNPVA